MKANNNNKSSSENKKIPKAFSTPPLHLPPQVNMAKVCQKRVDEEKRKWQEFREYWCKEFNKKRDYFNNRDNKDYVLELSEDFRSHDLSKELDGIVNLLAYEQKIKELTTKLYQLANREAEIKGERVETIPPHLMSYSHIISLLDFLDDLKQQKTQTKIGLNQAKSQVLADLKELKGGITDKVLTAKVKETYPNTITGADWIAHLTKEDNKITTSWQLAEYAGKVAKIIKTKIVEKEREATKKARGKENATKNKLADRENKINDLLGNPRSTPLPSNWERYLIKKSTVVNDLGLTDYADLTTKLDGANLGTQSDANSGGIPGGRTLKQIINSWNSDQVKITTYEQIIDDDLGFNSTNPNLITQIKSKLGGIKLKDISISLKELVDKYNSNRNLHSKLARAEKEVTAVQEKLEKYDDFIKRLAKIFNCTGRHFEENNLPTLEKDINDWLRNYREKTETELLTEINALGLGLNNITKKQVLAAIRELISKPNTDKAIVEKLREQIRVKDHIIANYQGSNDYMKKEVIGKKMQEILKILRIPTSHYYEKIVPARSLKEMGISFEKLLQEESNKKEQVKNKLITLNVILAVLTIGSLLTLACWLIRQKTNLPKLKRVEKKG